MQPGDRYRRIKDTFSSGGYAPIEKVGDEIEIEECDLQQTGSTGPAPDHARAVFLSGRRAGEKIQWAMAYIEAEFVRVGS